MKVSANKGIARILKAEGSRFVSLFPSCRLNNDIGDEGGLPLIMMRDERYGVAVADAYSRLGDGKRFGVCTLQGGLNAAGLEYSTGAILQAFEDNSPVLCLTDGVGPAETGNSHFNIDRFYSQITKWVGYIESAARVPEYMNRAYTNLKTGRPRPVLLQIPSNLGEYDENEFPYVPVQSWKPQADPDDVKAAVKLLLKAKNPVLYVGQGVFYADGCAELLQFVELARIPVVTTLKAKSAFPENHALSLGVRGEPVDYFLNNSDLVFAIGTSMSPNRFSHAIANAKNKTIIQCTIDTLDINKSYRVNQALLGDARLVLKQLIEEYSKQGGGKANPDTLEAIKNLKAQKASKYGPVMGSDETPINPYRVYGDIAKVLDPKNSFVTGDSGSPRDQTSTVWEAQIPHGYLGWGNVSTLGFSLAGAIASRVTFPGRQSVAITGDAGVGYMLGNIEAAVRYNLGITIVHINNSGFAGYGPGFWGPGQDPHTCTVTSSDVTNLSKVANALGLYSERIEKPGEIIPALKRALDENAKNRPAYLEFICCQYPIWGIWAGLAPKGASREMMSAPGAPAPAA
jgi:thiamine pyrophosphate-dependent acetolactate synthase large subunit-like protein